jgi:hypothetical protein
MYLLAMCFDMGFDEAALDLRSNYFRADSILLQMISPVHALKEESLE